MISDWDDLCLSDSKLTTEENELLITPYQPRGKSEEDVLKSYLDLSRDHAHYDINGMVSI